MYIFIYVILGSIKSGSPTNVRKVPAGPTSVGVEAWVCDDTSQQTPGDFNGFYRAKCPLVIWCPMVYYGLLGFLWFGLV